jgi:hypothetical protein
MITKLSLTRDPETGAHCTSHLVFAVKGNKSNMITIGSDTGGNILQRKSQSSLGTLNSMIQNIENPFIGMIRYSYFEAFIV